MDEIDVYEVVVFVEEDNEECDGVVVLLFFVLVEVGEVFGVLMGC
ncbi:hypothetical protein [Staphylococcus epidermidis]|nr:hypothetical protein [Staphylococcus epidermidis]